MLIAWALAFATSYDALVPGVRAEARHVAGGRVVGVVDVHAAPSAPAVAAVAPRVAELGLGGAGRGEQDADQAERGQKNPAHGGDSLDRPDGLGPSSGVGHSERSFRQSGGPGQCPTTRSPRRAQSTPAVISVRAFRKASISASVVNGPGLRRRVPSGKVPRALWA